MTALSTCKAVPNRAPSIGRTIVFFAALFAVTLNAFLPLAHAVSMRVAWSGEITADGLAARALWPVLCQAMGEADADTGMPPPSAGKAHECCLGFPNTWMLVDDGGIGPRIDRLLAEPSKPVGPRYFSSSGIRGDPLQPRAPPFLV
jgi:hypothetical protein